MMVKMTGILAIAVLATVVAGTLIVVAMSAMLAPVGTIPGQGSQSQANGLQLMASLNSSEISQGQSIQVNIEELNMLPYSNQVNHSTAWPLDGLSIGPCGSLNMPFGMAIFKGNLSASQLAGSQRLELYPVGTYACPMILAYIASYTFQPMSDNAVINGPCTPSSCFSLAISQNATFEGYYGVQGAMVVTPGTFTAFQPGVYTVAVGDEWGGLVVLHFQVV